MGKQPSIVVIGGGPSAIEAAITAKLYTDNVTIISKNKIGDWNKLGYSHGFLENYTKYPNWNDLMKGVKTKLEIWSSQIHHELLTW